MLRRFATPLEALATLIPATLGLGVGSAIARLILHWSTSIFWQDIWWVVVSIITAFVTYMLPTPLVNRIHIQRQWKVISDVGCFGQILLTVLALGSSLVVGFTRTAAAIPIQFWMFSIAGWLGGIGLSASAVLADEEREQARRRAEEEAEQARRRAEEEAERARRRAEKEAERARRRAEKEREEARRQAEEEARKKRCQELTTAEKIEFERVFLNALYLTTGDTRKVPVADLLDHIHHECQGELLPHALEIWRQRGVIAVSGYPYVDAQTAAVALTATGRDLCVDAETIGFQAALDRQRGYHSYVMNEFHIQNVGQLNVGDQQTVQNINGHIAGLAQRGHTPVAHALQELSKVTLADTGLSDNTRKDVLQTIEDLAEAAETSAEERKQGRIRGAIAVISEAARAATKLNEAWQQWGPAITDHVRPP